MGLTKKSHHLRREGRVTKKKVTKKKPLPVVNKTFNGDSGFSNALATSNSVGYHMAPYRAKWTDQIGKTRYVDQMTSKHLANTIIYLRKKTTIHNEQIQLTALVKLRQWSGPFIGPELVPVQDLYPVYRHLIEEATKRGLS